MVEPLLRVLDSADPGVRREAIEALIALLDKDLPDESRTRITGALDNAGVRVSRTSGRKAGAGARPSDARETAAPERMRMSDNAPSGPRPSAVSADPLATRVDLPRPASSGAPPLPHDSGTAPVLDYQKLAAGTELIGRFRVLERIGGGGFGTVYRVEDVFVKEELVLKILLPQLSLDPNMIKRFVQELKLTRRISHPSVIRIHDLVDLGGAHAISMEYFAGRDLGVVLREDGPLSPARATRMAEQVLEGLAAAHAAGVLHRDIKPANLLMGDGDEVRIVDFGLASATQTGQSRLTASGLLVGTPEYISPEQIRGTDIDERCDLYSFGVVLYEALSGKAPFHGATAVNVLFQHLEGEVPRLSQAAAGIPPELDEFVMRAMAREPGDRPASAGAMLEMLRARA
ncbi:MAG: protein kinase [Candidatus Eisenbacteria bacterium]